MSFLARRQSELRNGSPWADEPVLLQMSYPRAGQPPPSFHLRRLREHQSSLAPIGLALSWRRRFRCCASVLKLMPQLRRCRFPRLKPSQRRQHYDLLLPCRCLRYFHPHFRWRL
eukprot:scaffold170014_cov26-Tisochrysis_lutea.AAC.2